MAKTSILFISLMILMSVTSCKNECGDANPINDPVYFEFEDQNYAWGTYHVGWFIDKNGDFKYYDNPVDWKYPDTSGYILKNDLLTNLAKADSTIYSITIQELQNQIGLIDEVDDDKFSEIQFLVADIGQLDLYCYRWDSNRSAYKRIRLATGGDFKQENLDPEAKELTAWLIALGEDAGSFYWN